MFPQAFMMRYVVLASLPTRTFKRNEIKFTFPSSSVFISEERHKKPFHWISELTQKQIKLYIFSQMR